MSLARGLDYYTGVIFEAILVQQPENVTKKDAGMKFKMLDLHYVCSKSNCGLYLLQCFHLLYSCRQDMPLPLIKFVQSYMAPSKFF